MRKTFSITITDPDEMGELIQYIKGPTYANALWEIGQEIFRPARKHGYHNQRLNKLMKNEGVAEAIGILETEFYEIINSRNLEIE